MIDSTVFLSAFLGTFSAAAFVLGITAWKAKKKYEQTIGSHPMLGGTD